MNQVLNLNGVEIDRFKRKQLEEFLAFKLSQKQPLSFHDIQRNIGISRQQYEIIRSNNAGNKQVQWKIE